MSEEKEPYFDGPLVTPPSGQRPFYPGSIPQHNFGQLAGAASAPGFPQQAGPAFYNPNDFMARGTSLNPWEVPVAQEPQAQHDLNGLPSGDMHTNVPGTQAYFGGVDTDSSASSSQQTTPEHLPQRKVIDIPYNHPSPYEHQMYSAHSNSLFTPQVEGPSPQSQIFNPLAPPNSDFIPHEHKYQNSAFPPGGSSGQRSYAHPPASALFVPDHGPINLNVQNYMNPVPHDVPTQQPPSTFTSNVEELSNPQQDSQKHENASGENEAIEDESTSPINPMDLYNGAPLQSQATNDQSYMNMADYSGIVPPRGSGINSYIGSAFQSEAQLMTIPAPSSQDYDILHSQGTWEDQVPAIEPAAVLPRRDEEHGVNGAEAAHGMENEVAEDATESVVPLGTEDASHPVDVQNIPSQDAAELPVCVVPSTSFDEAEKFPCSEQGNDASLHDPTMSDQVSDLQKNDCALALADNLTSHGEPNLIMPQDPQSQPAGDSTLSLDYNNGSSLNNLSDLQNDTRYAYGPVTSASEDSAHQQSYADQPVELDSTATLQPDLTSQEPRTPSISGARSLNVSSLDIVNTGENLHPTESPESSIPADGLHPKQLLPDPNYSEPPLHFALPNSAFESRIRSQSTGSTNSNASSHRSTTNQPCRSVQNRATLAPCPTASLELRMPSRQETVPTSNPFSTNTMHSSHMSDEPVTRPVTTVPPMHSAIPPIPDIVRPLPSGSGDENLRTNATVPFPSTNQSLHSQVLRNRTAYPPEPVLTQPQSRASTSNRPQPDLIQSPPETAATVKLRTSAEVSRTVMALKTSEPPSSGQEVSTVMTSEGATPPAISHSYLSHSLHNSHSGLLLPVSRSQEPVSQPPPMVQSHEPEQSPESSLPPLSAQADDLHEHDVDTNADPGPKRGDEDSLYREGSDREHRRSDDAGIRESRDPRWNEHKKQDDKYRRKDYDDRYSQAGRWDQRDDRYRDPRHDDSSRSRPEHNSRPEPRESGLPDSYYSRHYDERYDHNYRGDPYYRDQYYNDCYQAYDARPHYRYDDRSGDHYYDSYHGRYQDSWHGRDRQYYDRNYYDSYYRDYRYHDQRRPDEEDSRSVNSERSRAAEYDVSAEQDWHTKQGYRDHRDYEYPQGYDNRHYEGSLVGESTLSNTYEDTWQRLAQAPARQTPAKFLSVHTVVRFGPGGHLIKVQPNRPSENQPNTVEIHSLEILLQNTPEAEQLRSYPGPLSKDETHKNDVLQFVSTRSGESMKDVDLLDRRSTALIWDFLALLVRQNGSVLGSDIAELLTKDHSGDFTLMQSPLEASRQRRLQQRTSTPNSIPDDQAGCPSPAQEHSEAKSSASPQSTEIASTLDRNCNRFRELLLHGRRKDALEWAMKSGLWGHALLLASKTDSRTHAQVMLRFANSLPINDPLQTVYQLMSGRQPAAATCVSEEGWGDWRPHLAMILSNPTSSASLDMRAVLTLGDTLSARGLLHAAHFCYLMSSTPLGYYGRTTSKMVLLGGNHTLPFTEFATWDSIRRTEIYEYAISLGKQSKSGLNSAPAALRAFQLYKFIYACKLAEYGLIAQAFHYCEHIAKSVCRGPSLYSAAFVNQLVNISDQLKHHDPQIQAGVSDAGNLRWLETLRNVNKQIQSGAIVPRAHVPSSVITTSNTPSVVSTTATSDSQTDEIRFSAHTPDQDDNEDIVDSGRTDPRVPMHNYGQNVVPVSMYSRGVPPTRGSNSVTAATGEDQQRGQSYGQEQKPKPTHNPNMPAMQGGYQQQFTQPSTQAAYMQPQVPMGEFSHPASQANPLVPSFTSSSTRPHHVPYQQQNSYGFNPEQEPYAAEEGAERADQYAYYDQMANVHNKVHRTRSGSPRSRTISQSSQRSRASTLKGYDRRATPTSMLNHADKGQRSRKSSENSTGRRSRKTSGEQQSKQQKQKDEIAELGVKSGRRWSLFGWFARRRSNQVHLPDDKEKEIVWDNEKESWVDKNATEEETAAPTPPPMDHILANPALQAQAQQTNVNQIVNGAQPPAPNSEEKDSVSGLDSSNGPPQTSSPNSLLQNAGDGQLTANRFSLKNLDGNRSMYKNAFSTSSKPVVAPAPANLLPGLQNATMPKPTGFMIPNLVPTSQPSYVQDQTPVHAPDAAQSIQMFTPANTPQGSTTDFTQPFIHGGSESSLKELNIISDDAGSSLQSTAAGAPPGQTMFFNPSQFAAQPDLLSQPRAPARTGNTLTRRGGPGYPGRR